ncbi:radical SAM protein [Neobacillus mesonae]|nr:radical SAM protein [Neobacillus mesonae]
MSKRKLEEATTKQTMNRVRAESMPFDWSINPYRGCAHGCSFCCARAFQQYIGKEANDQFQYHILMKMNAPEALEQQLSRMAHKYQYDIEEMSRAVGVVNIGTATDPYQPAEAKTKLTRECLAILKKYRIRTSITTRSPLILRDLDILSGMNISSINISLNTLDPKLIRKLEPAAPLPFRRLEAVHSLTASGIRTGLFVAPILPYLTDSDEMIHELMKAAKENRASFVMTSLLRLTPDVKNWFMGVLKEEFPEVVNRYRTLYRGANADSAYREETKRRIQQIRSCYELSSSDEALHRENEAALSPLIHSATGCSSVHLTAPPDASIRDDQTSPGVEQLSFQF